MEGWMSKKEVGLYIGGKSERTVERYVAKRILPPGRRLPGGTFWKKDVIDKWLSADYSRLCDKALRLREATP